MGLFHKTLNDALSCLKGTVKPEEALAIISAHVQLEHTITSEYAEVQRWMGAYQEDLIRAAGTLQALAKHRQAHLVDEATEAIKEAKIKLTGLNKALKDLERKTAKE